MNSDVMFHIGLSKNDGAKYAILPGDPGRVSKIAEFLDDALPVADNREFKTYSGYICKERVLVTSTGIGGPSAAIAVEELYRVGVRTIIRIGTCGAIQPAIDAGHLVIPTAAVRMEGTSREYMPVEMPAVADFSVVSALRKAAVENSLNFHVGIVQSKDSFYGQHDPDSMPVGKTLRYKWETWKKCGVLASEMETASIFSVAQVRKIRAGCVLYVLWNQEKGDTGVPASDIEVAIHTAVSAMKQLITEDRGE